MIDLEWDDEKSHELQNRIDNLIDNIKEGNVTDLIKELVKIRDDIPCSCGEEYDKDIIEGMITGKVAIDGEEST